MSKKPKGFASLKLTDPEKLKGISTSGGQRSQATGHGHRWTSTQAKQQGTKGAKARWKKGD